MDEYKSAPEVVHHGALLGACYMVDLLQDTEQPAKLRLDVAAQLYDRAYGRPPIAGALLDAGGAFAGARSVPGKDRRRPPRCRFPHAAGVGVSSRSTVSRVRRAAPRLLLAAVHRAVLHLGRRCSLWQSSTT